MSLFFLICSERSGSNFILKLLNGHKDICGPTTKHIINPVTRNLFRYGDLTEEANWLSLLTDIYTLMSVNFSIWKHNFTIEELKALSVPGDVAELLRNIFQTEADANGKKHAFIKENHVYEFLPFLMINYPDAKFIYQTRDPRDMALSWKKNSAHPGGVIKAAKQWKQDQQQNLKNYHLLKNLGKAHFVRYEDLIKDSERQIKAILDFLNLPFDEAIYTFHKDDLTKKNSEMESAWGNLSREILQDNSGKYKQQLSQDEIQAIEKICYFEMRHLGYFTETPHEELERLEDAWIAMQEEKELLEKKYAPSQGVAGNMKAKKRFYQR